ncbi:hypothetical protein IG631_15627 [Alternaria alternata]|jgi:hypothetical protein|nr:hypothetical protein IG631_15627 [Alternaria alternata]
MFEYARASATFARMRGGVEAGVGESESFTFHGCSVLAAAMVKGQSFPIASLHLPYTQLRRNNTTMRLLFPP